MSTNELSEQLEALREVSLELTAQLDRDVLLQSIVTRAIDLLGGSSGSLSLYQPDREVLELAVAVGPHQPKVGSALEMGEGLSGRIWETGQPLAVDDYQHWEGRAAVYKGYPWTAVMGAPVCRGEEFLGVLDVMADAPRTFSAEDADLLSMFATQAAIAIRNADLYDQAQQEIAERRRIESELRDSEERFRALIEQSPYSTVIYDPNGRTLYGNSAARALHQASDEQYEFILAHYNILEDEQLEATGSLPYIRKGFAGEATAIPPIKYEGKKQDADVQAVEHSRWTRGYIYPLKDKQGKVREVVVVHEDVSEVMRAEEELRQHRDHLEELVQARTAELSEANQQLKQEIEERQRIEQELRHSQERLLLAIEGTGGALWDEEWDPDAAFDDQPDTVYLSEREKRLLGYQEDELPHSLAAWDSHVLPEDRAQRERNQRDHFEGRTKFLDHEYRVRCKDGSIRWIHGRSRIMRNERGMPLRWIGIDWDITPRKQAEEELRQHRGYLEELVEARTAELSKANEQLQQEIAERVQVEEALRESEERFRSVVENAPFGYYRVGGHGLWQYVNPQWERMHGYSRDEVIGRSFEITQPEEAKEQARELVRRALSGETLAGEFGRIRKDGQVEYHSFNMQPVYHQGEIVAIEGFINDITQRIRAEEELKQALEWQRAVFEGSRDAIFISGPDARFVSVNQAACELTGYSEAELLSMAIPDLHEEVDLGAYREYHARILAGEDVTSQAKILRKDGAKVDTEFSNRRVVIADTVYMHTTARDITERVRAEQALRQANWVIENSPVMLFRWKNAEGWPVELASENVTQFGYTAEKLLSGAVPYMSIVHPDDLERVAREVQAYSSDGVERFEQEYRVLTKEGEVRWVDDRTVIERDADGQVTHYQGILMDITQRKRAEMEIKKLNEELFTLQSIGGAIASSLDLGYVLDTVSRGMAGLLDAESCYFSEWDRASDTYCEIAAYAPAGWRGDEPEPHTYHLADYPLTREVLVERRPAQMTLSQPDIDAAELAYMEKAKIKTLMMLPMMYQGQSIGLVDVEDSRVERTFTEQELALAQMLANQAANAIQNARLYNQAQLEIAERVRTEQALRESEERYRSFAQNFQGIAYRAHVADWTADFVDGAVEQITGYTKAEFEAGEPSWYQLIHPDDLPNIADGAEKILRVPNYTTEREYRIVRKDGGIRWILELAGNICDDTGRPNFVQGALHDITKRVRAEEALRQVEERMRTFLESVDDMVYFQGLDGSLSMLNGANARITGYSLEEFAANPQLWQEIVHPDDRKVAEEFFAKYPDGMPYFEVEYRIRTKSGEQRWIQSRMVGAKDGSGRYLGYNCIDRDITDRKRADEALRESETRFRTLVEQIPNSVTYMAALDETSTTLYISPQVVEILGYSLEEYQADPNLWAEAIHPADYDRVVAELARCHEAGERFVSEYRIKRKDGEVIWFHDEADIVRDKDNNPLYLLGVNTDVTARKQAEEEQDALISELEARNAELERFTYTVSHDLKSPLITIKGFLGFLARDVLKGDAERVQADVARISNAADKMQRLLDELLELSRIGRIVNPPEVVPLADLARETVDLLSGRLTEHGVAVQVDPDLPLVYGDRQRLTEVLENLVDNAVKFTGDQSEPLVKIGARQDGEETVIYVRDNGVGIEPCYQDKVFGLFEKLDADSEGSGIGLAIVRRIVEVHGGRIWVESEGAGQGSAFCFTLPEGDRSMGDGHEAP